MDRKNVCKFKQLCLGNQLGARRGGLVWRQVLAPCDDFHSKRPRNPGNLAPDIAEAKHAERLASNAIPNGSLPTAGPNGSSFNRQASCGRENEPPGQLYRRTRLVVGMHHFDAALRRRLDIESMRFAARCASGLLTAE